MISNDLIDELERLFSRLSEHVSMRNKQDRFDINKELEGFIKELLKRIGYNLENLNIEKRNYPAIDLAGTDPKGKHVAIQVTSTVTNDKVKKTFDTFFKEKLDKKYGHNLLFIILHTTDKPKMDTYKKINIKKNILNLTDILQSIANKDLATIKNILAYVNEELKRIQTTEDFEYEILESVINDLLEKINKNESERKYNYSDFDKLGISKKINRNQLSHTIRGYIQDGLSRVTSVKEYLNDREKTESGTTDQLIGVLKIKYGELTSKNKTGDTLFKEMLNFVTGSTSGDPPFKFSNVGVALLTYFFEKCEIFEK